MQKVLTLTLCGAIGLLSCASLALGAGEHETPQAAKGAGQMPVPTPMIGQKHRHHRSTKKKSEASATVKPRATPAHMDKSTPK